jgi:Uma2 family endonuclease
MTFAEYEQIPNPPDGVYELYHGELVKVGFSKQPHVRAQWQLRRLLESAAGSAGIVKEEMPFRPLPEYECWCADVAYLSEPRWDGIGDYLFGVPELVIEILSPSNSAAKLREKKKLCLENGAVQFWMVDVDIREVEVSTRDGRFVTYKSGQEIPLFFGGSLPVDAIFA